MTGQIVARFGQAERAGEEGRPDDPPNVTGLAAQVAFNTQRNADIQKLMQAEGANTQFQPQDRQNAYETTLAQIQHVAKAAQQSAQASAGS